MIPVFDCGIFIESIQTMEQGFLQSGVSAVKTLRIVQAIGIQGISVWGIFRIILFGDFHTQIIFIDFSGWSFICKVQSRIVLEKKQTTHAPFWRKIPIALCLTFQKKESII